MITLVKEDLLGKSASLTQLSMLLRRTELDFLSENHNRARVALIWIEKMTRAYPGSHNPPPGTFGSPFTTKVVTTSAEWDALRERTLVFLSRYSLGLDYYGFPRNYVPLVSYGFYKANVPILLDIAEKVESNYLQYRASATLIEDKIRALRESIREAQNLVVSLRNQDNSLLTTQEGLNKDIVTLNETVLELQSQFDKAKDAFIKAATQPKDFTFLEVVQIISAIIVMYENAAAGISMLANVFSGAQDKEIQDQLDKSKSDTPLWIKKLEVAGSQGSNYLDSIMGAYARVKSLVDSKQAKLVVFKNDFEKEIEPYLNLPAAREYRELVRAFVDVSSTLGQKVLDLNAVLLERRRVAAEILQTEESIKRYNNTVADTKDPSVIELSEIMASIYAQSITSLLRTIYQERRALEYFALAPKPLRLPVLSSSTLKALHQNTVTSELDARNNRTRADQLLMGRRVVLSVDGIAGGIDSAKVALGQQFTDFKNPQSATFGKLAFTFSQGLVIPGMPSNAVAVTAKQVDIQIPGMKTSDSFAKVTLVHSGKSYFRDMDGNGIEFSHGIRSTTIVYSLQTGKAATRLDDNLGGKENEYVFLSPYTTWRLLIDTDNQPILSDVRSIELIFDFYFLTKLNTAISQAE